MQHQLSCTVNGFTKSHGIKRENIGTTNNSNQKDIINQLQNEVKRTGCSAILMASLYFYQK